MQARYLLYEYFVFPSALKITNLLSKTVFMVHHLENHACFGQGRYIGVGTSEQLFIFLAAIAGVCVCKAKLEQPDF